MRVIIDGYNLIPAMGGLRKHFPRDLETARSELAVLLRRFKKLRGHDITVVYDGRGGQWDRTRTYKAGGIMEVFTSREKNADDHIIETARRSPQGLIVVSGDREIASKCSRAGAAVLSPKEFEERLMKALLMEDGGGVDESEDGRMKPSDKKGPSRRLKKRERQKLRKKAKL